MEQGLWTAIFSSGSIAGGGVVYLSDGKLIGGDSQFYFVGTYGFNSISNQLDADIAVIPFVAGAISIFGLQLPKYELKLSGVLSEFQATITGYSPVMPQLRLSVKLVKRMEGHL